MNGTCHLSLIPVRSEPSERSEMVTQMLFGESYEILEDQEKWLLVRSLSDNYEGWIDQKMSYVTEPGTTTTETQLPVYLASDLVNPAVCLENNLPVNIVRGSILPAYEDGFFYLGGSKYSFEGNAGRKPAFPDLTRFERIALSYINTPYLWGGRSPFGIDCSGFVQMVFRFCGIDLPRDAHQQAMLGETIDFVYEAKPGDLAFFDNATGNITHVGIILGEGQIIHASGSVRIDTLDHNGIFNRLTGRYTHNLRIIKRLKSS